MAEPCKLSSREREKNRSALFPPVGVSVLFRADACPVSDLLLAHRNRERRHGRFDQRVSPDAGLLQEGKTPHPPLIYRGAASQSSEQSKCATFDTRHWAAHISIVILILSQFVACAFGSFSCALSAHDVGSPRQPRARCPRTTPISAYTKKRIAKEPCKWLSHFSHWRRGRRCMMFFTVHLE